jgi:AraC-like DNA-binding protein
MMNAPIPPRQVETLSSLRGDISRAEYSLRLLRARRATLIQQLREDGYTLQQIAAVAGLSFKQVQRISLTE